MRLRSVVAASVLSALVVVAGPGIASARLHPHDRVSINAAPNPIVEGEGVLVYGQLTGSIVNGQTIRLYHHIAGGPPGYSQVQTTHTDAFGFYELVRADGVVTTNRSWFVVGPDGARSRIVFERVAATVALNPSDTTATTGQPVMFTGHVTPNHAFQHVLLQEQTGSSSEWRTLKSGLIGPGSGYAIRHTWRTPGERDVRVVLPGDARNIRSESDAVPLTIQQKQVAGFTINSSDPIIPFEHMVRIFGVLTPSATAQPSSVQLWAHPSTGGPFELIGSSPVSSTGEYGFMEMPSVNTVYQARTTFGAVRASANLWEGVQDLISLLPSSTTSEVGGLVGFSGMVVPAKTGHVVYLQRLNANGDWQSVEAAFVRPDSTFGFVWRFAEPGTYQFRARIYSDGQNVGAESTPVTITVSGLAPVNTLPPSGK